MKSTIKNFILSSSYQILAIIIPLITTPYISRVLGAEKIGLYSYSYSIVYYFVMIGMLGINNYGNRTIAQVRDNPEKLRIEFWSIYVVQLVTTFFALMLYLLYLAIFGSDLMSVVMCIYMVSALFDINWVFFGLEQFKVTVARNSIVKIVVTICIFIFVKETDDIYYYALLLAGSTLISQICIWPMILKIIGKIKIDKYTLWKHFKADLVLFIPVIAVSIYKYMDKVMLGSMGTLQEVGFYENAEKIIQLPTIFVTALGTIMLPRMSTLNLKGDSKMREKYLEASIIFAMFLSTSLCFGIMSVSKEFIPIFLGEGYYKCVYLLYILLPSCMFVSFANVIRTQVLIPQHMDKQYSISMLVGCVINLIMNYVLIPQIESLGAAIATLIVEIVVCILQIIMVGRHINVKKMLFLVYPYVLSGLVMFVIVFNLSYNVIIKVSIGIVVYLVAILCQIYINKKAFPLEYAIYDKIIITLKK